VIEVQAERGEVDSMDQDICENNKIELMFLIVWIISLLRSDLLDYYTTYNVNSLPTFRGPVGSIFKGQEIFKGQSWISW